MSTALLVLGAVGHVILWVALVNRLHGLAMNRRLMDALTGLCGVGVSLIPLAVVAILLEPQRVPSFAAVATWVYISACAVVCVVASGQRLWTRRHPERRGAMLANHTTRLNLRSSVAEPLVAPGIPTWLARLPGNQVFGVHVHEKQLAIPRLAPEHAGLRIVHIADLHMSGRITRAYFRAVMDCVNECRPDLIAITGDLVEREECIDWILDTLGRLRAPGGVYYVLGNHDLHVDERRLKAALADVGLIHVGGRVVAVTVNNTPLVIAGNELPWYKSVPPPFQGGARGGSESAALRILLSHSPDQFAWAQQRGFDLMLAGHNHGGQVRLPFFGPILAPSLHGVRYASGAFRGGDTILHVTRGAASLTPLRFNCPPEIAVLVPRSST